MSSQLNTSLTISIGQWKGYCINLMNNENVTFFEDSQDKNL